MDPARFLSCVCAFVCYLFSIPSFPSLDSSYPDLIICTPNFIIHPLSLSTDLCDLTCIIIVITHFTFFVFSVYL